MSKITFRADDDLVERLEACDASKSEVMREALRAHLDDAADGTDADAPEGSVDDALTERIDDLIADRLDAALTERLGAPDRRDPENAYTPSTPGEINVNVTLDAPGADDGDTRVTRKTEPEPEPETRKTRADRGVQTGENVCGGCGENVPEDHVYCPNCGEKQSHRAFCECGDEVRTDWAFCPGCGRRTPAADVLKDR
ncbi:double zinc ribbon domain-containing protein [Halorubrum aethiopicum]|uniref:double zinc ribbon domain-containing protein n=1 Tax=Halorubrum aethiopicum TaxID=1758255 RepID=UPI0008349AE0|nr:zinc ribbon domain-containing protein [Halorubrum aethiopicum]